MCNKCKSQNIHLHFPGSIKNCCNSNVPNLNYLIKPEGGENGDVLVKNNDNVIWIHVSDLFIEPTFSNTEFTI